MTLQQMRYLASIGALKSISKAAQACFISQPALTQQLKQMEEELGVPLFVRARGGMELTEEGKIVMNSARGMLYAENHMRQAMDALYHEKEKAFSVMCQKTFCKSLEILIDMLRQRKYPDIKVEIIPADRESAISALEARTAAMAIFNTHMLPKGDFTYQVIRINEMYLAFSPKHSAADQVMNRGIPWTEALWDTPFLLHKEGVPARVYEDAALEKNGFVPKQIVCIENEEELRAILPEGRCAGFLPYTPHDSGVLEIPLTPPFHFYTVMAWNTTVPLREELQYLRDLLLFELHESG